MLEAIESLRNTNYSGHQITVQKRKQVRMSEKTFTPCLMQRNTGENSGPIFLTHTPKNFEAAQKES